MQLKQSHGVRFSAGASRGSSLLEVMIAILILAVGMLGMAALQSITLKNSNSSSGRSQAVIQTYSLFDSLRLNRTLATGGNFNVPTWTNAAAVAEEGSTSDYSVFNSWLSQVQATLGDPAAYGKLVCSSASCTVGIKWDDSRATGDSGPIVVETTSRL